MARIAEMGAELNWRRRELADLVIDAGKGIADLRAALAKDEAAKLTHLSNPSRTRRCSFAAASVSRISPKARARPAAAECPPPSDRSTSASCRAMRARA